MAEKFHVTNMKAKVVEPPKEGGRQGAVDAWNTARNAPAPPPLPDQTLINNFRSDRYSTFNAKKRKALADAGLSEDYGTFSSGEPYQPPMAPGEIVSDMGSSIAPTAAAIGEGTAGVLGDLADGRYALAHYLNKQMSGGVSENRNADDFLKLMEKYDPLSYVPNTEDVSGAMDPLYEVLGIKDDMRYQPKSPWGQGLYTAGQFVDPYAAGQGAVRGGTKLLKGIK